MTLLEIAEAYADKYPYLTGVMYDILHDQGMKGEMGSHWVRSPKGAAYDVCVVDTWEAGYWAHC